MSNEGIKKTKLSRVKNFLKKLGRIGPTSIAFYITFMCSVILFNTSDTHLGVFKIVKDLENRILDFKFNMRGYLSPHPDIALITIDSKSVHKIGRWPWARTEMGRLIKAVSVYEPKVLGFDIVFSEPSSPTLLNSLKKIQSKYKTNHLQKNKSFESFLISKTKELDYDIQLANAIKSFPNTILGYYWFFNASSTPKKFLNNPGISDQMKSSQISTIIAHGFAHQSEFDKALTPNPNIELLNNSSKNFGFFNAKADSDGIFRKSYLLIEQNKNLWPSLALKAASLYLEKDPVVFKSTVAGKEIITKVSLGDHHIYPDQDGRLRLNFLGSSETFPHYSFLDVVDGKDTIIKKTFGKNGYISQKITKEEAFKNKILFVGMTDIGLYDLRATPFQADYPGVELHATLTDNILQKRYLSRAPQAYLIQFLLMVLLAIFFTLALSKVRALHGLLLAIGLIGSMIIIDYKIFFIQKMILNDIFILIIQIFLIYLGVTIYRFMTEEKERSKIKNAFQKYVAPEVVATMLKDPTKLNLGGEKKVLSILFSDIRSFTTISEKLDAQTLSAMLNNYLTPMTDIVFQNKGTLDKYMGDAVMAFFGAPVDYENHAEMACLTAIQMMEALDDFRDEWTQKGYPYLNIGIGVNTGEVSVGNMGSDKIFDYTVMGDHVNLGSRLEGINKVYGTNIIISEFTQSIMKETTESRLLDLIKVKGKTQGVKIYELIGLKDKVREKNLPKLKLTPIYGDGFENYLNRDFNIAIKRFEEVLQIDPTDLASKIFVERCKEYEVTPPPEDWDGAFTMVTK